MKVEDTKMSNVERVCEYLKEAGTYFLATVDGDQPRVRPFGTAHIFEGKLYIQTGLKKDCAKQLLANPKAEISAMGKDGTWIRVTGRLVLDERIEAQESMLDDYQNLRRMYQPGDGNTAVFCFEEGKAVISSFTAAPVELEF